MQKIISAHAKINLTLDITGKRADGYHDIKTIMHSVALADIIAVCAKKSAAPCVRVKTDKAYIPCGPTNTVYKAAMLFMAQTGINADIEVDISKKIPVGAGLGGGSADAAAVINALDDLFCTRTDNGAKTALAACVGADVPFCVFGGCALAEGIGEKLTPLPVMPQTPVVICKPRGGVSTAKVFGALAVDKILLRPDTEAAQRAVSSGDINALSRCCFNVLTEVTLKFKPVISSIKRELVSRGALCAEMTGSGSAVFALFDNIQAAQNAAGEMKRKYAETFLTTLGAKKNIKL